MWLVVNSPLVQDHTQSQGSALHHSVTIDRLAGLLVHSAQVSSHRLDAPESQKLMISLVS